MTSLNSCSNAHVSTQQRLALAHLNEWACYSWNHWFFLHERALELARKAVDLDDRDHRAHCMLGLTRLYARDYEGARRQLLKALELNPNDADVLAHASVGMALIGEHTLSVETGRNALRLVGHALNSVTLAWRD